jgi:serine/threonine protein kinase
MLSASADSFADGRFLVVRQLGAGGFGDVYQALDRTHGGAVALKVLRRVDPVTLLQFKREFRSVAQLVHPNLIRLYELIQDGESWLFTMELLEGSHLLEYIRGHRGARREAALRRSFDQLTIALAVLHDAGIVHRDVKPSNVMATPQGRIVLLDFGVAKQVAPVRDQPASALVGTPAYLAPERIEPGPAVAASDWYSVGVMLYQALTGALPFAGDSLDVIINKRDRDPPSPTSVVEETPPDLSDLCMDLLRRDPRRRPTAFEIRQRLNAEAYAAPTAATVVAPAVRGPTSLVARTRQLEDLRHAFERVRRGRPVVVHVTGLSGIGKTSLVQRFLTEARTSDPSAAILTGVCHQEESVAFNALDELVDRLTDYLEQLLPSELALVLPLHSDLIGRVFPVFRRVLDGAGVPAQSNLVDPVEIRRQAFSALRALLRRLCERSAVIIAIDDVQWGDRDSASFLHELLRFQDAPAFLLILCYRRHSVDGGIIERLADAHQSSNEFDRVDIEVTELSPAEGEKLAHALLESRLPALGGDEIKRIAIEAGGSPFMIHRLVHHLLTTPRRLGAITSGTVIAEELERFEPVLRRLIELVAVAGQPLPLDVALRAATEGAGETIDLGALFAAHLLQMYRRGADDYVDTYHDQIRKHVLDGLTAEARSVLHRTLIDAFEAVRPQESERLAFHCEQGGRFHEAATYALAAADQAGRALAFDRAVALYGRALDLGAWDAQAGQRILMSRARTLADAGRGSEAATAFLAAAEGTTGIAAVRLRIRAADQYLRTGHLARGQALLKVLLAEVGLPSSDRRSSMILSILWNRARAAALLRRLDDDRVQVDEERLMARMEVLWAAAVGLSMYDPISSAYFSASHLVLALKSGNVYRIALSLAGEATQCAHRDGGRDGRPQELLQTARRYARRSGDPHALAFVRCMAATVAFLGGRWTESVTESVDALNLLRERCTGVWWEMATATLFIGASNVFRGELAEQARLLPAFVADARSRGDVFAAEVMPALTMSWLQHLVSDDPDSALKALPAWPPERSMLWRIHDTNALTGRVQVAIYRGEPAQGWALLEEYWPSLTRSPMFRVITIRTLMSMSRAACALSLASASATSSGARAALLRTAEATARSMEATRCGWATALALLTRAGVASCRGDTGGAARLLERAASDLRVFELIPWHQAVLWQLASLEEQRAGTQVAVDAWWTKERIVRPDRIAGLLVPGAWPLRATHTRNVL